jgi:hypothetical protein
MLKDIHTNAFYKPLWRRILIVAATAAWFGVELWHGGGMWMTIAGAFSGFAIWAMLISYPKETDRT